MSRIVIPAPPRILLGLAGITIAVGAVAAPWWFAFKVAVSLWS